MHRTGRQVRFSVNPFLAQDSEGANSFASKPAGEGLSMFFELTVELAGAEARLGAVFEAALPLEMIRAFRSIADDEAAATSRE